MCMILPFFICKTVHRLWKSLFQSPRHRLRRTPARDTCLGAVAAEVLEHRALLSAAAPAVTLAVQGSDVTLTSTDINNPTITVTRSGNNVMVTGTNGTLITFGSNVAAVQSAAISSVNNLTVGLGTGNDTVTITGLSVAGNITINGQASGIANITINAGAPSVVIGGSIQANLGSEAVTFGLFGSSNDGGSLTVNGSVNIAEAGAGNKQVNIYGPPANNPTGGKLIITGGVSVLDTGNGQSGLHIDDGVTVGGNVSFDNSANTVDADNVQIYSNSNAFGTTSIAGSLTLALSRALDQNNAVLIQGFGTSLVVTGAVSITSGGGADNIQLLNDWFKTTTHIVTGSSPSFSKDLVSFDGSRFDGATTVSMSGPYPELDLGIKLPVSPTVFKSSLTASLTGAGAAFKLSNAASTVTDYINAGNGLLAHLIEDGTSTVVFVNEMGNVVLARLNTPTQAVVPGWGNDVATIFHGKITWSDGSVWNQPTTAALPVSVIDYTNSANQMTAHVVKNGTSTVVFVNESGNIVQGTMNASGTQATVPAWGNLVATFGNGQIKWSNGSIWNLTTNAAPQVVVTDYTNPANGLTAHVVQNGTNTVVFVNVYGYFVLGSFTDTVQATVSGWGNDVATFGNGQITWSDGSSWNLKGSVAFPITVTAYVNPANNGYTYMIRSGTSTTVFINEFGSIVLGSLNGSGTTATVAAWGGDVATFGVGRITWSDGSTWNSTTNAPPKINVVDYFNVGNGRSTHMIQAGTSTTVFINEFGSVVLGSLNGSLTQATVTAWGGDVATFGNGKITWSDGAVWVV